MHGPGSGGLSIRRWPSSGSPRAPGGLTESFRFEADFREEQTLYGLAVERHRFLLRRKRVAAPTSSSEAGSGIGRSST